MLLSFGDPLWLLCVSGQGMYLPETSAFLSQREDSLFWTSVWNVLMSGNSWGPPDGKVCRNHVGVCLLIKCELLITPGVVMADTVVLVGGILKPAGVQVGKPLLA